MFKVTNLLARSEFQKRMVPSSPVEMTRNELLSIVMSLTTPLWAVTTASQTPVEIVHILETEREVIGHSDVQCLTKRIQTSKIATRTDNDYYVLVLDIVVSIVSLTFPPT